MSDEKKLWRKEMLGIFDSQVPQALKDRLSEYVCLDNGSWQADRVKTTIAFIFQDEGVDGANEYIDGLMRAKQRFEEQEERDRQRREKAHQISNGVPFSVGALEIIKEAAHKRMEGKEHADRRPHVGIRVERKKQGFLVVFSPVLASSPDGWVIKEIDCDVRPYVTVGATASLLKAKINGDGVIRCRRRPKDLDSTARLVNELQAVLNQLATNPMEAFKDSKHCCFCGKGLTDDLSKARGIGPECNRFLDEKLSAIMEGDR